MLELTCTPEGLLVPVGDPESAPEKQIRDAFADGAGMVLVQLGTSLMSAELEPAWAWLREWSRRYFVRLCQAKGTGAVNPPSDEECDAAITGAPPFTGAEYLSHSVLREWWISLGHACEEQISAHPDGLAGWLKEGNAPWHLVGRVTFHLAENKTDSQKPFAFLATFTENVSATGQVQHLPLARALQLYAGQKDQSALQALLEPVRAGAVHGALLREWLTSRRLFQPLALTPPEAYRFLRESAIYQESGIVVKMPDWWRGGKAARPMVQVSINAPKGVTLDARALMSFHVEGTIHGEAITPEEWDRLLSSDVGLVSLRGHWVEVDGQQLRDTLQHWRAVQAAHAQGGVNFLDAMRMLAGFTAGGPAAAAEEESSAMGWSEVVAGKEMASVLKAMREPGATAPPERLRATLRPYQAKGLSWLDFMTRLGFGACLADDMGLGKTLQIIALLALRQERGTPGTTLLVVPASLVGNWRGEFARFAPTLKVAYAHPSAIDAAELARLVKEPTQALSGYDAMLTTYQFLARYPQWQDHAWGLVILDEAQAIKNPGSQNTRAVKKVRAEGRIALTGTPVENRPGDLWSLFDFLNPGLLGKSAAFSQAVKRCATSPQGFAPIRNLARPYILRRMKTDRSIISDLPDKTEVKSYCGLSKRQAVLYEKLVSQLSKMLADPELDGMKRKGLVLGFLIKFKQVCNHPGQWAADGRWDPADSGKFQRLQEICTELAERQERALIFTQFQEMCEPLTTFLSGVFGREGLMLHGATPVKKRPGLVEAFQKPGGPPFFVISVKAGGTGLTLTAASHVIHFDRWWNPAVENQATDRAFRIGQKRNVMVHKFICQGTMEERIDALIDDKKALAADLLGSDTGAESLITEMSNDDLLKFVSLDLNAAVL